MTNLLEVSPQRWNLQQVLLLLILQMSSFSLGVQSEYPLPPLRLHVTTQNSTSLSISWTSPDDTNKDHYQYNVLLSKDIELVTNITRGLTNYTFTNLSPGTDYNVSVSSLFNNTKSQAAVIPTTTDPSPPLQLRVATQSSTSLSVSWTSSDDTNKDHYQYEVLLSKNMELVTNIRRGQTNYIFTNLSPGTDYNVSASSLYHERKSQATVIPATTNPSPPLQLRVTPQNSTSLSISWTSPDDTNKDHYEYNVLLSKDMELVTNITMEQTNYTFTNLSPGTDYNVSVSSLYHERKSEAAVIPATTTPGKLQNFASNSTVTSITLQWEASQSGKDVFYQITYNKVRSSPIETNETSFTLTSLSPNTNYSICIASCLWISTDMCSDSYCKNISTDPTTPPPPPIGLILGLLGGAVIILIITLVLYRWRHLRNKKIKPGPSENHTFQPSMKIPYSKFEDYFQQLNANGGLGFAEQYETLKNVGKSQPRTAGQLPSNLPKNRYKDIVPYDHSSVFLSVQGNDTTSDYINANYIAGFSSQKEFIASQGPLPSTVVDFWRMVWEQEVSTIVMLAQCVEAGRPKCEQYWPDDKQPPHNYGKFIISLLREDNVEHWIVRALEVRNKHNNETRRVSHYHFRAWPYYGVPRSTSHLIDFVSVVYNDRNKMNTSRATVVHSSAGVGRTGTFLALDHAMQQIEHDNMVSVYKIVKDMRSNRCMMVQTEIQYVFLHKCVSDHLKSKRSIGDPIISQNQKV